MSWPVTLVPPTAATWTCFGSCYHPDAYDNHGLDRGGLEGLVAFVEEISPDFVATTHHLGQQVIDIAIDGHHARAETSCLCWYRRQDRSGAERSIVQGLRFLDRLDAGKDNGPSLNGAVVLDWEHVFGPGPQSAISSRWRQGKRDSSGPSTELFAGPLSKRLRLNSDLRGPSRCKCRRTG
jgi:hypothetical protein